MCCCSGRGLEEPDGLQAEHHESVRWREALSWRAGNCPLPGANCVIPPCLPHPPLPLLLHIIIACPALAPPASWQQDQVHVPDTPSSSSL